jgi:uncharacterized protein YaeQ
MALTATIHNFEIELADSDRSVYESLALRVARHPSESEEYLVTRLLAYLLEYAEGIEFSRGVSDPEDPAIAIRDLTGAITTWIDIGTPDAARLHKASKSGARVVVYTHKNPDQFLKQLSGEKIHRGGELELYAIDRALDRRARRASRSAGRVQRVGQRARAVCLDRLRYADGRRDPPEHHDSIARGFQPSDNARLKGSRSSKFTSSTLTVRAA